MHQEQLTIAEATKRLRDCGYLVEHQNDIIYARVNNSGPPDRVYVRIAGFVSAYAVKRLENKMALSRA